MLQVASNIPSRYTSLSTFSNDQCVSGLDLISSFGDDQTGRTSQWLVVYHLPACLVEPLPYLINAVHVPPTRREQELASHKRRENRLRVRWVRPEVHEE